jgi:hypothetical protein
VPSEARTSQKPTSKELFEPTDFQVDEDKKRIANAEAEAGRVGKDARSATAVDTIMSYREAR